MKEDRAVRIERQVVIGMISSTDFLNKVEDFISPKYALSEEARYLMLWIFDYYAKYKKAPGKDIITIYEKNLDSGRISDSQGEVIEDILESLSEEAEKMDDLSFLQDQAEEYANFAKTQVLSDTISDLLESGDLEGAQEELKGYSPIERTQILATEPLANREIAKEVFADGPEPLFTFNGPVGDLLNPHMVRGGFVVLMGQNKGGKSYYLTRLAFQAASQGRKVFLAQAGDMTQNQQQRRMAIMATGISDQEQYCRSLYYPVLDCRRNQLDTCDKAWCVGTEDDRPFDDKGDSFFDDPTKFTNAALMEAYEISPKHVPCIECLRKGKESFFRGTIWPKRRASVDPMDDATYWRFRTAGLKKFKTYYHAMRNIRLSTHSSESLTMFKLKSEVKLLEEKEGWKPDIVISDYLDLQAADRDTMNMLPRDQENKKWQRGRRFSQDEDILFLSATQSDAQGFNKMLLDKSNFSEDRRKLDHVTAMIGLNMTIDEKRMGILRMNEIASRETDGTKIVHVMHRLEMGQPILNSYY